MKASIWSVILAYAAAALAVPVEQAAWKAPASSEQYPGFSLDLSAQRLVQIEGQPPVWMSELEKINAKAQGVKFFDITETQDLGSFPKTLEPQLFPSPNSTLVKPVLKTLSTKGPRENLKKFTSFRTRYYRSDTGKQSQQWLLSRISEITEEFASPSLRELIVLSEFPHSWGQNSIVLRIQGSSADNEGLIIIGAHQDSTNMWPFLPAPGADDDGSGTVTILEAYRALIAANFRPVHTVEFHWYSAEEGGLLGSQAVARDYEARRVNVLAMSQFDMTAWVKRGTPEKVGIITDFVDAGLTKFNMELVDTYLDIPYVETKCGYACSDQLRSGSSPSRVVFGTNVWSFAFSASWMQAGYPSSFTIESSFEDSNQLIHSTNDRIDISDEFSFDHMLQFCKLAVAFAIELGGWAVAE